MSRRAVRPRGMIPDVPLSHAIIADRIVYCSGQVGVDWRTGRLAGPGIREQTAQALRNLAAVLRAAGCSLRDVAKCTVFLTRREDFDEMNRVYERVFPPPLPARSTVIVASLVRPEHVVEIEAIAHRPRARPA